MPDLFTPKEFSYWAKFYYEKYGFKCIPVCGKEMIYDTDDVTWDGDTFTFGPDSKKAATKPYKQDDWLEQAIDLVERYPHCLTGIGCFTGLSNVIAIDFDNEDFFYHWKNTFKIDCPLVKSGKGFHVYVRSESIPIKTFCNNYYDVQSWLYMVLPPSIYYKKTDTQAGREQRQWVRRKDIADRYTWISMSNIPTVDLMELGLIPKWFLTEPDKNLYNTRVEKPTYDNKISFF